MAEKTGARFIAETLKGYGISHVFYLEAILRRTLVEMEKVGINRVLAHSEKSAAYMADGFSRISNKPALCMGQSVGAANLAAGLQDAYLAHTPLLAFTGRKPPLSQYRNSYQEIDHNPMYDYVTKFNARLDTLEQLPILLPQAFREATTGTPGPVHIDFLGYEGGLTDTAKADFEEVVAEQKYTKIPVSRPAPDAGDIKAATEAIRSAKKPVIIFGRGAVVSDSAEIMTKIMDTLKIPAASSVDGKSLISDLHPLYAGAVGTYARPCANKIVAEADLVIFAGTNTGDQVTRNWELPPRGTKIIQIDINPSEIGRNYQNVIGLQGDCRTSLEYLYETIGSLPSFDSWAVEAAEIITDWRESVKERRLSDDIPIRPERLCRDITETLSDNAIVVADTGYSAIWAATMIDITKTGQSFLRPAGSLGWAFPASLGAKCAAPNRPVICFTGDGALWYHIAELETAARWNINTVTVINNNSALGQCLIGIGRAYGDDTGKMEEQSSFKGTNFANIAREMGCYAVRVTDPSKIQDEIRKALAQDKPAVLDVVTNKDCHPSW
jgi:acetolactate synthase I/II/III large subunit